MRINSEKMLSILNKNYVFRTKSNDRFKNGNAGKG